MLMGERPMGSPAGGPPQIDPKVMRGIGIRISLCMGITLSFFESLTGSLIGGHFSPVSWLISFLTSTVISIILGLIIPMGKISRAIQAKHGPGIKSRLLDSLVSDLIYTPIITTIMVTGVYLIAMKMSGGHAELNYLMMLLTSFIACFVVGYIIIFIVQPIFMNIFIKNNKNNKPENK